MPERGELNLRKRIARLERHVFERCISCGKYPPEETRHGYCGYCHSELSMEAQEELDRTMPERGERKLSDAKLDHLEQALLSIKPEEAETRFYLFEVAARAIKQLRAALEGRQE